MRKRMEMRKEALVSKIFYSYVEVFMPHYTGASLSILKLQESLGVK